jgi:hypothetical protein
MRWMKRAVGKGKRLFVSVPAELAGIPPALRTRCISGGGREAHRTLTCGEHRPRHIRRANQHG